MEDERLHLIARRAFERTDLLDSILVQPPQRLDVATPRLEDATCKTYFAIDRATAMTQ